MKYLTTLLQLDLRLKKLLLQAVRVEKTDDEADGWRKRGDKVTIKKVLKDALTFINESGF